MPHLMNCQHSYSGWCLSCVKALETDNAALRLQVERMRGLIHRIACSSFTTTDADLVAAIADAAALAQPEKETTKQESNDTAIIARFIGGPM